MGLASYKLGRLVAKERVTEFVRAPVTQDEEATEPKREGGAMRSESSSRARTASAWDAAGFSYGLVLFPRQTRS